MGSAFKCDITGKLVEGVPQSQFLVALNDEVSLLCYPQKKLDPAHNVPGAVAPEVVKQIEAALGKLFAKK